MKRECFDSDSHSVSHMFSVEACEVDSPQVKETQGELRQLQIKDPELACYVAYLENGDLPTDDRTARKVVLGSKQYEMIDTTRTSSTLVDGVPSYLRCCVNH